MNNPTDRGAPEHPFEPSPTANDNSYGNPFNSPAAPPPPQGGYSYTAPPPPASPMPPPQKVRRIGTLTMGFALVATGVASLVYMFVPTFDILTFAKIAPVVLILLGLEILISNFFFHNRKLTYDILSTFVCLLLILTSVGILSIPPLYEQYGPRRYRIEERLTNDFEELCYSKMSDITSIIQVGAQINLGEISKLDDTIAVTALKSDSYIQLNINLRGDYKNKAEFAGACKPILSRLVSLSVSIDQVTLHYTDSQKYPTSYDLRIDDKFGMNLDTDGLVSLISEYSVEPPEVFEKEQSDPNRPAEEADTTTDQPTVQSQVESAQQPTAPQAGTPDTANVPAAPSVPA